MAKTEVKVSAKEKIVDIIYEIKYRNLLLFPIPIFFIL